MSLFQLKARTPALPDITSLQVYDVITCSAHWRYKPMVVPTSPARVGAFGGVAAVITSETESILVCSVQCILESFTVGLQQFASQFFSRFIILCFQHISSVQLSLHQRRLGQSQHSSFIFYTSGVRGNTGWSRCLQYIQYLHK